MKFVSVVMPVFNCEAYLKESIESILNQSFTNFELIIINDCSTDRSANIIKSFKDSRIRYFVNNTNKGIVSTLNAAIYKCRGKYVARMDGDDIAHVERLEKQVNFLENNLEVGLLSTWYIIRDSHNNKIKLVRRYIEDSRIRFHMLFRNQFLHPGVMMRTSLLKKLRYHDVSACEDYDLWTRMLDHCKVANLPEFLMVYRWHGSNVSFVNNSAMRKSMIYIISNLLNKYEIEHTEQELLLQVMVALAFNKEQISVLGKLDAMEIWLNKLSTSKSLKARFGEEQLSREMVYYKKSYNFN